MTLPAVPTVSLDDIRTKDPARRAWAAEALKMGFDRVASAHAVERRA